MNSAATLPVPFDVRLMNATASVLFTAFALICATIPTIRQLDFSRKVYL